MKRQISKLALVLAAVWMMLLGAAPVYADETIKVDVPVTFGQTEARSMLEMINDFRTGPDAWQLKADGTKETLEGLEKLEYDYALEKAAMQRAVETALSFSHTRPDGTDCFTAYPDSTYWTKGENIAAGSPTASRTFIQWQETDKNYAGQGHRRNMLSSDFTAVGIGHVIYNGIHYWVQEFGNPAADRNETVAADGEEARMVEIERTSVAVSEFQIGDGISSLQVTYGDEQDAPDAKLKLKLEGHWPEKDGPGNTIPYVTWTVVDPSVAELRDGKIIGKCIGKTIAKTVFLDQEYSYEIQVVPIDISAEDSGTKASGIESAVTYTGAEITFTPDIFCKGIKLTEGTDYTVAYEKNTDAGTAAVLITGTGNYTGTWKQEFTIEPQQLKQESLAPFEDRIFSGEAYEPEAVVEQNGSILKAGADYEISYENHTDAGTAVVTVTGKGNYAGEISGTFQIRPLSIEGADVDEIEDVIYHGSEQEPELKISVNGTVLLPQLDYTVSYLNNVDAGTAVAVISGVNNYTGSLERTFTIQPLQLEKTAIAPIESRIYSGEAYEPEITVRQDEILLKNGTDYTVSYSKNVEAGQALVTVTGKGNFTGEAEGTFTIQKRPIGSGSVSETDAVTYNGTAHSPSVTVILDGKTLDPEKDYTVSYEDNTNAGSGKILVTGIGNYTGELNRSFTIRPLALDALVSFDVQTYSGKELKPAAIVEQNGILLKDGTDYETAYADNVAVGKATVTVTGAGNYTGTISGTFEIIPRSIQDVKVDEITGVVYHADAREPELNLTFDGIRLVSETDYTAVFSNNTNVGNATVTITGKGNYTGTREQNFAIAPQPLEQSSLILPEGLEPVYTGEAYEPEVTIVQNGITLEEGTDYQVSYADNVNAGTARILISGAGNYTGEISGTFEIVPNPEIKAPVVPENAEQLSPEPSASETPASQTPAPASKPQKMSSKKGTKITDKKTGGIYKVTKAGVSGKAELQYVKPVKAAKKIVIPDTVTIKDIKYQVTSVAANAFKNNKKLQTVVIGKNVKTIGKRAFYHANKLSTIQIKSKKLTEKTVGTQAFKGIAKKAVFKLPKAKLKSYKKLLLKKGASKTMKFKK